MRYLLATLLALLFFGVPWIAVQYPNQTHDLYISTLITADHLTEQAAALILSRPAKTVEEIRAKYIAKKPESKKKVRILLVPGHEPNFGGTQFGSAKENEIVVSLAEELEKLLKNNSRFEVFVTRDKNDWRPEFSEYFQKYWNDIIVWKDAHKKETAEMVRVGQYKVEVPAIEHLTALTEIALRLYGINKWAGENDIDIAIHIHLNDYPRAKRSQAGEYSGFAIYVPENQYQNSLTTQVLANTVFSRLEKYNPVSNYPPENEGIVEDQELIAVGSYNTLNAASMLIEYGYVYETQFVNADIRDVAVKDLAFQTYMGLMDFFDSDSAKNLTRYYDTVTLPYKWKDQITVKSVESPDVFALQTALILDGVYPPEDKTKNDCPRSGLLGSCTKKSLSIFQNKHGITDELGIVGKKTVELLNKNYGN